MRSLIFAAAMALSIGSAYAQSVSELADEFADMQMVYEGMKARTTRSLEYQKANMIVAVKAMVKCEDNLANRAAGEDLLLKLYDEKFPDRQIWTFIAADFSEAFRMSETIADCSSYKRQLNEQLIRASLFILKDQIENQGLVANRLEQLLDQVSDKLRTEK